MCPGGLGSMLSGTPTGERGVRLGFGRRRAHALAGHHRRGRSSAACRRGGPPLGCQLFTEPVDGPCLDRSLQRPDRSSVRPAQSAGRLQMRRSVLDRVGPATSFGERVMARLGRPSVRGVHASPAGCSGGRAGPDGWSGPWQAAAGVCSEGLSGPFGFARRLWFVSPRFNLPSGCTTGNGTSESVE